MEGAHDSPDGAEQAYVGARGSDGGQRGQIAFEPVEFAHLGHPHRTARTLEQLIGGHTLLPQAAELAESRLENALLAGTLAAFRLDASIQRRQIAARPECGFKSIGLTT